MKVNFYGIVLLLHDCYVLDCSVMPEFQQEFLHYHHFMEQLMFWLSAQGFLYRSFLLRIYQGYLRASLDDVWKIKFKFRLHKKHLKINWIACVDNQ